MLKSNFSAKTLDDAITKACIELGITSDMLDYTVVEQGSAGILGIGARPWVIAACNKAELEKEKAEALEKQRKAEEEKKKEEDRRAKIELEKKQELLRERNDRQKEDQKKVISPAAAKEISQNDFKKNDLKKTENTREDFCAKETIGKEAAEEAEKKAVAFLKNVFESIGMNVEIKSSFDEMLSELNIELSGDEMGVLIGKRGQTLDSLQYLLGQIVNKHLNSYVRVKLDTENYRERRQETLENLAHNMASRVRRSRHAMALEPMNPYERRIIHSALQDEKDVMTRSEGEEPYRHVVVCYVKHKR